MHKERVTEIKPHELTIDVREPAERNEANVRVCALVASHYDVNTKDVKIISGFKSGTKKLSVLQ
jgi:uncharacterized protein YggU (UPF0235/DUF167 family)